MVWVLRGGFCLVLTVLAALGRAENVLDAIRNDGELSSFYQLAERAKLFVAYSEGSDITVFAPTNDALDKYRENNRNKDVQVTYHVVSLNVAEDHLPSSVPTIAKGSPHLFLTRTNDRFFFVNNAKVIRRRDLSHNGLKQKLYVIDDVLEAFIPTSGVTPTALEFLNQPSIYNLNHRLVFFHSRIQMTQEGSLFSEEGAHTFFVPIDSQDAAGRVRVEIDKYVVRGHVIKDRRLFMRTMSNETYQSAAWEDSIRVELSLANQSDSAGSEYTLFAQSNTMSTERQRQKGVVLSKIIKPNIPVKNGVVHLIEKPLMVVDTSIHDFLQRERHGRLEDFMRLFDYSPEFQMDLEGNQPKTIFAPTNEALKVIPSKVLDNLKANTSGLTKLLRLHMIKNEAISSDQVLDGRRTGNFERESASSRRMLYMRVVEHEHGRTLTVEGGGVNATAVQADIGATNGVIHIIDRVLGMPSHAIYEKINSDPELKDTRRFAQHRNWIERLKNTDKRYTLFAPNDNAWHDIKLEFPSEYKQLSMDQFGYHAEKILERHLIVGREIPQAELENLKTIETARGKMDVRNVNGKIHLLWEGREAVIVRPDVQATNGVIHVISKVMMLRRDMTSSAAMTATSGLLVAAMMLVLRTARCM
ncbi:unnamed protein product [Ixodes hexagonus]